MSFDVTFVTSKFGKWSSNVRQWVNLPPNRIGGLEHEWIIFPFYIWDVIQTPLMKSMIFQDGHIAPPTRLSFLDLWSTSNHQVHLRVSSGIVARCYYSGGSGGQTSCLLAASCWPSWWLTGAPIQQELGFLTNIGDLRSTKCWFGVDLWEASRVQFQ